jgi:AraC-like DNA-binding protein
MRPPGMVAVLLLRVLLDAARRAGVATEHVLSEIGVDKETLDAPNGWISVEAMTKAWAVAPALSKNPNFGLHAGESAPTGVYGLLEFAIISSPTVYAALERVSRFYRLIGAMSDVEIEARGSDVCITVSPLVRAAPNALRHYDEYFFALLATRARVLAPDDIVPRLVRFTHDAPQSTAEHARIFRAPVSFSERRNELVIERAALETPMCTSNASLASVLEQTSDALMTSTSPPPRTDASDALAIEARVRAALPNAMRAGDPSIAALARKIGTSPRTLQRKLRERGVSYAHVVDDVRREIAERHIEAGDTSFGEIAFTLGFSQPSAFHRAFKRWTGTTAATFRTARRGGARGQ